jgi:hypothetical protein
MQASSLYSNIAGMRERAKNRVQGWRMRDKKCMEACINMANDSQPPRAYMYGQCRISDTFCIAHPIDMMPVGRPLTLEGYTWHMKVIPLLAV